MVNILLNRQLTHCVQCKPRFILKTCFSQVNLFRMHSTIIKRHSSLLCQSPNVGRHRVWMTKKIHYSDKKIEWVLPHGTDTGINLYNSLTNRKEKLVLPTKNILKWYCCGPTVYDNAHVGHACCYVRTDALRRIFQNMFGIDALIVMGITNIDDKIINRANETNQDFTRMAEHYEREFFHDMAKLNVLPPVITVRVTDFISQIIAFVQKILSRGLAYITPEGNVYFDVEAYGQYGKLIRGRLDGELRPSEDKRKKSPKDFALWKPAKPLEPFWDSPWGKGRPGWHIECSTMAGHIFGSQLDLHSGGDDLRFPHHENELAQSEAFFQTHQWTNYWLHTGCLHSWDEVEKMSKSLCNTVSIHDLLQKYTANQFRLFCMLTHYRHKINYSTGSMGRAVDFEHRLLSLLGNADAYIRGQLDTSQPINSVKLMESLQKTRDDVKASIRDDFNTPQALHALDDLVTKCNLELKKPGKSEVSAPRDPATIAAVSTYIIGVLEAWGIQVSSRKDVSVNQSDVALHSVVDNAVNFRNKVRQFALDPPVSTADDHSGCSEESSLSEKQKLRKAQSRRMQTLRPLLEACDKFRNDLLYNGVEVQDHSKMSSWKYVARIPLNNQDGDKS